MLAVTFSITANGIGWAAAVFLIIAVLAYVFAGTYRKVDDWWTPLMAAATAHICAIIGIIFGLIWLGSKI